MINLRIETHDGISYEQVVDNYEPIELNEKLNNNAIHTVALGDLVISRINVKSVRPFEIQE